MGCKEVIFVKGGCTWIRTNLAVDKSLRYMSFNGESIAA